MKKTALLKKISAVSALFLTGTVISCSLINDIKNMEIPDSVAIKAQGTYELPLGDATAKLKDHLTVSDIVEKIKENSSSGGDSTSIEVYDYYDTNDSAVQKFLFNYPLAEVPLDISSYLSQLDELDLTGSNSFSQKIKVDKPEVTQKQNLGNQIDFNKVITDQAAITLSVLTLPRSSNQTLPPLDVCFTSPDFDAIEFETGALVLTIKDSPSGGNEGIEIRMKVILCDASGNEISNSGDSYTVIRNSSNKYFPLEIPMDGKTLKQNLQLKISATGYGEPEDPQAICLCSGKLSISDSTKIKKIKNVSINDELLSPYYFNINTSIDTSSLSDKVKSAVIADGQMFYYVDIPSGWSGITINPQISMTGDLSIDKEDFSNKSSSHTIYRVCSLNGKTFEPDSGTTISGQVSFSVNHATLVLSDDDDIIFEGGAEINALSDAKIYLDKLLDTSELSKSMSEALSDSVTKYIKKIFFKKIGLEGTIDTDLPSSNMKLDGTLTSAFFGILPGSPLEMNTIDFSEASPYDVSMVKDYGEEMLGKNITDGDVVDFSIDMDLASTDALDSNLVTLSSFVLDHEYSFDFNIGLVFDWDKVVLNTGAQSFDGTIDTGMNLSSFLSGDIDDNTLISEILDKTQFKNDSISGYLFITRPELEGLNDFQGFHGSLTATYTDETGTQSSAILPESDLDFVTNLKTFAEIADENYYIEDTADPVNKKIAGVQYSAELAGSALVNILNVKPESLVFDYSLAMAGSDGAETITITKDDIEGLKNSGNSTSIKISIAMILGLKLQITDDIHIENVFESFGVEMEDDLLGRESADEESDFEEYADLVKNIKLEYLLQNNIGLDMSAYFIAVNEAGDKYLGWDSVNDKPTKAITIRDSTNHIYSWKKDKASLNFTRGDIKSIFANYKFIPQIVLDIKAKDITVPRDASISAKAVLSAQTDNEYVIWGDKND
jgi:hypothetical protein